MKKLFLMLAIWACAATTFAQLIPEGEYVIKFASKPDYVLTLKDGKASNSNPVHLWQWRNDNSQKWKVTHKDGKIVIRSMVNNNYVLDVEGYNYSNNANVYIYSFHGGNNQLWIPEKQSNGSYVLMTAGDKNFCLDLYNGNAVNDGKIELWSTHKGFQEQWIFEKTSNIPNVSNADEITDGVYVIRFTKNTEFVVTLKEGKTYNGSPIHLWQYENKDSQKWRVTHKDGKIVIRSMVDNNYVLDVKGYNYSNNAEVYVYSYHGGDNQLWIPEKQSNGSYVLMTAGNKAFCLDLYNGHYVNGGVIELWSTHKGWQEQWTLQRVDSSTPAIPHVPEDFTSLTGYRDKVGQTFTFWVKAKKDGRIWGGKNNIYTDDSDLATACFHAGIQPEGNVDKVVVKILPDQGSYPSLTRNGITSISYGAWKGAYQIIGIPTTEVTDPDISKYRDKNGEIVKVRVTGRTTGTVYGTNAEWGYMDKSDLATAAVHAGKLKPGETGILSVRVKGGSRKHDAVLKNGIQSKSYGQSEGTFKIKSCQIVNSGNNNNNNNNNSGNSSSPAGVYDTNFNEMTLQVNGNKVTGTYNWHDGRIEGTLSGHTLTGRWTQSNGKGRLVMEFNSDFSAFTGKWDYNEAEPSKSWSGKKK